MYGPWVFFREFLHRPTEVASLVPSSPWLTRRLVEQTALHHADTVVELGPGSGGTTRALLRAMDRETRLLAVEINGGLFRLLQGIDDPRLIPHHGSAANLAAILDEQGLERPEVIVSGIPFSKLDRATGEAVVAAVAEVLKPSGRFVAYQLSPRVAELTRPLLGEPRQAWEVRNLPPLRIYRWHKPA
ncbi:class I SAM-dependent methyltransferase [Arhodomonas sp. SL1]|uniref:class I SAM-dependent methyltransferase n=1 Tax=Arhodomonas sp. SL1 TaxID=3425691 RepID=UPI003F8832F9